MSGKADAAGAGAGRDAGAGAGRDAGAAAGPGAGAEAGRDASAEVRSRTGLHEGIYEVFARKRRGDPLRHIGYIDAPGDELARVYAWKTYDEENWFEMCVVPRGAVIPVNRSDGPWAGNRPGVAG